MRAAAAALLAGIALQAAWAQRIDELPSPGSWPDKTYRWAYNPQNRPSWLSADAAKALLIEAATQWEICGVRMEYLGETSNVPGAMDWVNVVGWSTRLPAQVRGVTVGRALRGKLYERDIAFSAERPEFQAHPELLRKVLVHEFGHAIGLTHSGRCDDVMTLATDCPRADPATLPIAPTAHDIERCRAMYARDPSGAGS